MRETGKNQLEKQLAKIAKKPNLHDLCEKLGFKKIEDLYIAVGQGELSARTLQKACGALAESSVESINEVNIVKQSKIKQGNKTGILIDGEDGLLTTLAKCCKPAPPDDIVGFVTRGRGVSIHRSSCPSLQNLALRSPDKTLLASWPEAQEGQVFAIELEVRAQDRSGLLRDISDTLARHKLNVTAL